MENLIPVVNKLLDVFCAVGANPLDLPQIVVVGSQSSGKSSVLESIVGRDFLPRGKGIVTRRPLILQLRYTAPPNAEAGSTSAGASASASSAPSSPSSNPDDFAAAEEWGEFGHKPGHKFTDFDEIRREIVRETKAEAGGQKAVSDKPINLKIFSPQVLDLTLVDLPGITKVAVEGQPQDIERRVRDMCLRYISRPNSIILAVTAGTTDIANSDALKLARKVDPEGTRTVGVITKLDQLGEGSDALDVLTGKVIPLRKGYIGVVNRSQQDILTHKSMQYAREKERAFFASVPAYNGIRDRLGIPHLSATLNVLLMQHIRECLPKIKQTVTSMLANIHRELDGLGTNILATDRAGQGRLLLSVISNFASSFSKAIEGRSSNRDEMLTELYGGARISYIFHEIFGTTINTRDHLVGLSDDDIRTAIRNATGPRPALFVPEVSFELLVRRQIAQLELPGLQCVEMVFDELNMLTAKSATPEMIRFSVLRERVIECVTDLLRQRLRPTKEMVVSLIQLELSYINTNHPDFIGGSRAIAELMARMQQEAAEQAAAQQQQQQQQQAQAGKTDAATPLPRNNRAGAGVGLGRSGPGPASSIQSSSPAMNSLMLRQDEQVQQQEEVQSVTASFSSSATAQQGAAIRGLRLPQIPRAVRLRSTESAVPDISDREKIEVEIIKSLVHSYYAIVRKNFVDLVPKAVMALLVNHAKDNVQSELVRNLYREELFDDLLRETDDITKRRRNAMEMQALLQRASEIINEVRDFKV
eukprot:INCI16060.2.p1 GENE.INCI16060.2~~INCI16060.2.p1  ORF type:complete len:760 (+),score=150.27 INCI16060.2:426-2705(+)